MKVYRWYFIQVLIFSLTVFAAYKTDAADKIYKVGDRGPAGGWIFFDKGNDSGGWRYLEAAPEDQSKGVKWAAEPYRETGAKNTYSGSGRYNSKKILKKTGHGNYAAKICEDYRGGGKSDWFLPSKDEVDLMYKNLHKSGIGSFANEGYWSSSEGIAEKGNINFRQINRNYAWYQHFYNGYQNMQLKMYPFFVRAVRAF